MDNPHIIRIHDIFEENATAYYVMEYIDGDSLDRLIQKQEVRHRGSIKLHLPNS